MIVKPTVFILGAGASAGYRLPLGEGLTRSIVQSIAPATRRVDSISKWTGIKAEILLGFARELEHSHIATIDSWLEKRPEFIEVGKIAICHSINISERPGELNRAATAKRAARWYRFLWNKMSEGINDPEKVPVINKISFITFNYDRSLEQYLFNVFPDTYGVTGDRLRQILAKINILHIHGQNGYLDWQCEDSKTQYKNPYMVNDDYTEAAWVRAKNVASQIKIVSEPVDNRGIIDSANKLMHDAKSIVFLGFGYHRQNLGKIKLGYDKIQDIRGIYIDGAQHKNAVSDGDRNGFGKNIELTESVISDNLIESFIKGLDIYE